MSKKVLKTVAIVLAVTFLLVSTVFSANINTFAEDFKVYYNGRDVYTKNDNKPIIIDGRSLAPIRPIFEALELGDIYYDDSTKTATFTSGDTEVEFTNEDDVAYLYKNSKVTTYKLDVPATIYNGNFYVPIRAFCEMWGADVEWDDYSRSVYITMEMEYEDEIEDISDKEDTEETEDEYENEKEIYKITENEAIELVEEIVGDDMSITSEESLEDNGYIVLVEELGNDDSGNEVVYYRTYFRVSYDGEDIEEINE